MARVLLYNRQEQTGGITMLMIAAALALVFCVGYLIYVILYTEQI